MKNLNLYLLFLMVNLASCDIEIQTGSTEVDYNKLKAEISVASDEASSKDSSDSVMTNLDAGSCLGKLATGELIITGIAEGLLASIFKEVDIHFEDDLISLIEEDITQYKNDGNSITPKNFWKALSKNTSDLLEMRIAREFPKFSKDRLKVFKIKMSYAFIFYFEQGVKSVVYKLKFSDRRGEFEDYSGKMYISFAGSKKKKDAVDTSQCGYIRFNAVEINEEELDKKILCWDEKKEIIFRQSGEGVLIQYLNSGKILNFDFNDVNINENDAYFKIKDVDGEYPEYEMTFKDLEEIPSGDYRSLEMKVKKSFWSMSKTKDFKCLISQDEHI